MREKYPHHRAQFEVREVIRKSRISRHVADTPKIADALPTPRLRSAGRAPCHAERSTVRSREFRIRRSAAHALPGPPPTASARDPRHRTITCDKLATGGMWDAGFSGYNGSRRDANRPARRTDGRWKRTPVPFGGVGRAHRRGTRPGPAKAAGAASSRARRTRTMCPNAADGRGGPPCRPPPPYRVPGQLSSVWTAMSSLRTGSGRVPALCSMQPPAGAALLHHRPGAVAQPAERVPQLLRQPEQVGEAEPDRGAVRDHDEHAVVVLEPVRPAPDRVGHPRPRPSSRARRSGSTSSRTRPASAP